MGGKLSVEEYYNFIGANVNVSNENKIIDIGKSILNKIKGLFTLDKKSAEEKEEELKDEIKQKTQEKKKVGNEGFLGFGTLKYETCYVQGFKYDEPGFRMAYGEFTSIVDNDRGIFSEDSFFLRDINRTIMPALSSLLSDINPTNLDDDDLNNLFIDLIKYVKDSYGILRFWYENFGVGITKVPVTIRLDKDVNKDSDKKIFDNWKAPILGNLTHLEKIVNKSTRKMKKDELMTIGKVRDLVSLLEEETYVLFWKHTKLVK